MTVKLYWTNPYDREFQAQVKKYDASRNVIILDATLFYPTGGGQPHDTGEIELASGEKGHVIDVVSNGDEIEHTLRDPLISPATAGDRVKGTISWERRFDFMQQHTGQHLITRVLMNELNADTISLGMADNLLTIDLDKREFAEGDLGRAEQRANEIITQNVEIFATLYASRDAALADGVRSRLLPSRVTHNIRIVTIAGVDVCACGGTHLARSGELGMIKIVRVEPRGNHSRLELQIGYRALRDYARRVDIMKMLALTLTGGWQELPHLVTKLKGEYTSEKRGRKMAMTALLDAQAQLLTKLPAGGVIRTNDMNSSVHEINRIRVFQICLLTDLYGNDDARSLARRLTKSTPNAIALVASARTNFFVFSSSEKMTIDLNMNSVLQEAVLQPVAGKGGGKSQFAFGNVPEDVKKCDSLLTKAREYLSDTITS